MATRPRINRPGSSTPSKSRATSTRFTRQSSISTAGSMHELAASSQAPSATGRSSIPARPTPSGSEILEGLHSTLPHHVASRFSGTCVQETKPDTPGASSTRLEYVVTESRESSSNASFSRFSTTTRSHWAGSSCTFSHGKDRDSRSRPTRTGCTASEPNPSLLEGGLIDRSASLAVEWATETPFLLCVCLDNRHTSKWAFRFLRYLERRRERGGDPGPRITKDPPELSIESSSRPLST